MAMMSVPFESNAVIFVRGIPDWPRKAAESFPGRQLYLLEADEQSGKGFVLRHIAAAGGGTPR